MDLHLLLSQKYSGMKYTLVVNEYNSIYWFDEDHEKPTLEELEEKWKELQLELPMIELRRERDRRLATTDWVTLKAYSTSTPVPEAWATYMQALRDLPATTEDPKDPEWPAVPA